MFDAQILKTVAKGLQALQAGRVIVGRLGVVQVRQIIEMDQIGVQPVLVDVLSGNLPLEFFVADDATLLGINQEHPARLQATLFQHPLGLDLQHADLRGHNHQIVFGDVVA